MSCQETNLALREFALKMPGAYEEYLRGERVAKVNKKVFVFFGLDSEVDKGVNFGVKLPISNGEALNFHSRAQAAITSAKVGGSRCVSHQMKTHPSIISSAGSKKAIALWLQRS